MVEDPSREARVVAAIFECEAFADAAAVDEALHG